MSTHTLALEGPRVDELAGYLHAMGVLRVVAEQVDRDARGWWQDGVFRLESPLDADALVEWFLGGYSPTPATSPWNQDAGFSGSGKGAPVLARIEAIDSPRLAAFRETIAISRKVVERLGVPATKEGRGRMRAALQRVWPDAAQPWLDAVSVMDAAGGEAFNPLLGSYGCNAREEFGTNYGRHVAAVFASPDEDTREQLSSLLFGGDCTLSNDSAAGQNCPTAEGDSNPWAMILAVEGLLVMRGGIRSYVSQRGRATAFPFLVDSSLASGSTVTPASEAADARLDFWAPVWAEPKYLIDVAQMYRDGMLRVDGGQASSALGAVRAIRSRGCDLAISEFRRHGFRLRNGKGYFTAPLEAVPTGEFGRDPITEPVARWIERIAGSQGEDFRKPAEGARVAREVMGAAVAYCQLGTPVDAQRFLLAVAGVMRRISRITNSGLLPVPPLPAGLLADAYDGSVEYRIAAGVAGTYSPEAGGMAEHCFAGGWGDLGLVEGMSRVAHRRLIETREGGDPFGGAYRVSLADVDAFVRGDVDDARIGSLVPGLSLLDWRSFAGSETQAAVDAAAVGGLPHLLHSQIRCCSTPRLLDEDSPKIDTRVILAALASDGGGASRAAVGWMRATGRERSAVVSCSPEVARRAAVAMLIPVTRSAAWSLARRVCPQVDHDGGDQQGDLPAELTAGAY